MDMPKVSLACMSTAVFGVTPVAWKRSLKRLRPLTPSIGLVGKLRKVNLKPCSVICGSAPMLMTKGTPCCSQTWAMARVPPDSKAPTSILAPSRISFSACVRATSAFDSVSAFISSTAYPLSLRTGTARSQPRWHCWPIMAR